MIHEKPGEMLRHWRKVRRLSQMDLAEAANVSTRHLSFVETGRSYPSQDLILRLSAAMQLPLRHTNAFLIAAGYAPQFQHWSLDDDPSGMVKAALEHILAQHEPYPAVVVNRVYDVVMVNQGFQRLLNWLMDGVCPAYSNIYWLVFETLSRYFVNWPAIRRNLLKRLYEESVYFQDIGLAELYDACASVESPREQVQSPEMHDDLPVLTFSLRKAKRELCFFSTYTSFGTAIDVTTQELRIESLFPADPATRDFLMGLVDI